MRKDNFSIGSIVERFSNAIHDLAEVQKAINIHDEAKKEKCMSDAGEALSQTLEWALHRHFLNYKSGGRGSGDPESSTPEMIKNRYLDGSTEGELFSDTISGERPTVDFTYLCNNKGKLTNDKKHAALSLDFEVQKKYASEVAKFIHEYLDDQVQLLTINDLLAPDNDDEIAFYKACNSFSHLDCLYLLLLDRRPMPTADYTNLSRVTWDLVIDLYSASHENGFISNILKANAIPYKTISVTDRISEDTFPSYNGETPVILANGFSGKASYSTSRDWNKSYYPKLAKQLEAFFNLHPEQKVVVVSLVQDAEFVRLLFNCIDLHARGLTFVIANDTKQKMNTFPEDIAECIYYSGILCRDVNQCIGRFIPTRKKTEGAACYLLPGKDGFCSFSEKEMRSYQENFEVLYQGIDEGYDENEEDYLNGSSILTWEGAHRQFAALRTKHPQHYVQKVERELSNGARKAMLIHEPGYGGTTVARQIAYDLHTKYPTLILKQYKISSIKTQLEHIYDCTNKPLLVIAEIPQAITTDEFDRLKAQLSSTRPILLLGVRRGMPSTEKGSLELVVADWGNDVCRLAAKYRPYLKRYPEPTRTKKEEELNRIVTDPTVEAYMRTPFYIGLLTFEEDFYAMDSYLRKFAKAVSDNESQRKVLVYLSICDVFGTRKTLPEGFFATVFNEDDSKGMFRLEERFNKSDGIVGSLLHFDRNNSVRQWQIKHPFFSRKLLPMLLNGAEHAESRKLMNLSGYCKQFITDIANSPYRRMLEETVLQQLFIGTKADREGEKFTRIIMDLDVAEQEDVLNTLHTQFPDNAHFCSHLARFYSSVKKDFGRALELADRSITLSEEPDAMLYHIKAMCFSHKISSIIEYYRESPVKNPQAEEDNLNDIIENYLPQAEDNFSLAREYQRDDEKEITYLPNIYMLIKLFDYAIDVRQLSKRTVLGEAMYPYCDWIDRAQSLLESLKQTYVTDETEDYTLCETRLWTSIKEISEAIDLLNSQLDKGRNTSVIRRQLVRAYINRNSKYKEDRKLNQRLMTLMEENIAADPTNEKNYLLWLNVARYSDMPLEAVISKMNQWRALNPTKEVIFYSFVFNALKAIQNDSTAAGLAKALLDQCHRYSVSDSIRIKEWYVSTRLGIKKYKELSADRTELVRVQGIVTNYKHPGDARILLDCGLEVFFKPSIKGITEAQLNSKVSCFIGFSYDGIRALDDSVTIEND